MTFSATFIRRPVATILLMIGLALAGLVALVQLPVSALPQVEYPTIVVSTYYPGASASTMAEAVTSPLERQLGQMPSLVRMSSTSSFGYSQITLQFALERSIDAAEQDVQAAINASAALLPRQLPSPPVYSKSNPADAPVLTLAISSETMPLRQVSDVADSILVQKISQVRGAGLVTLSGSRKPAVRIRIDPVLLAAVGLSLEDVRAAVVAANINQPKGNVEGVRQSYTLSTNDQLADASAFRELILSVKTGAVVRLRDVASVEDGVENELVSAWADQRPSLILNVQRQPGANVIEVAEQVKALLPRLRGSLPAGLDVRLLSDRTETIRASIEDVEATLALTVVLVVAVIFVFLRNVRATLIPAVTVPLSILTTFGVMYLLGYSLNNLTLMALTISTGFVVDDAIVMVENVARHIEEGKPPRDAALAGAEEIGFTIVSLTVSLIAVLIPLFFMGGVVGRLFREFATTLATAIAVSAFVSLTLTATMCAYMLKDERGRARGRVFDASERLFDASVASYSRALSWVLRFRRTTLAVTVGTLVLTGVLAFAIPKGFFPLQDTGLIVATTDAPGDTSSIRMGELQQEAAAAILADPDVASVASFVGSDGTNTSSASGRISIALVPRSARKSDASRVLARLRERCASGPGLNVTFQIVQDLQVDARPSRSRFQYTLESTDAGVLSEWVPRLVTALRSVEGLKDVASDRQYVGVELALDVDRDSASRFGVTQQAIDETLYDAFGQRQISTIFTQLNLYRVILETRQATGGVQATLDSLYVRSSSGSPVPLSSFVHVGQRAALLSVQHEGQLPSAAISFDLEPGTALGTAVTRIRAAEGAISMPPAIRGTFRGTVEAFDASLESGPLLILAALGVVYLVLGILYESYVHPLTILSTLPSAGVGALVALFLCRMELTVIAIIGMLLLIGIVKKNAIMMIDFAIEARRTQGLSPEQAIRRACLQRFRPIMMTTFAALFGGLPLALGRGMGAELRQPLGVTIVGGLLLSQLLTLFTTPVVYLFMCDIFDGDSVAATRPLPGGREV